MTTKKKTTKKGKTESIPTEKKTNQGGETKFKPGNQFWKARSSHGRNPKFETPDILWKACTEYFQWVEDNPLMEEKVFHTAGIITRAEVGHMVATTVTGLCLFLDIHETTWAEYRKKTDFTSVTARVDNYIKTQKLTGAAADLLNPNIIARDLGLVDKKDVSVDDKRPVRTPEDIEFMTKAAIAFAKLVK